LRDEEGSYSLYALKRKGTENQDLVRILE
jgi:hypothetical protein